MWIDILVVLAVIASIIFIIIFTHLLRRTEYKEIPERRHRKLSAFMGWVLVLALLLWIIFLILMFVN